MLRLLVASARIPEATSAGPGVHVSARFRGVPRSTRVLPEERSPTWDETLAWPLGTCPLRPTDTLTLRLRHWGQPVPQGVLGATTVSLEQLVANPGLPLSLSHVPLLDPQGQPTGVRVRVIEGHQLQGNDIKPVVTVLIGQKHFRTRIQTGNNPYYNEVFWQNFRRTPARLAAELIVFQVLDSRASRAKAIIGVFQRHLPRCRRFGLCGIFYSATMVPPGPELLRFELSLGHYGDTSDVTCKPTASVTPYCCPLFDGEWDVGTGTQWVTLRSVPWDVLGPGNRYHYLPWLLLDAETNVGEVLEEVYENESRQRGGEWGPAAVTNTDISGAAVPPKEEVACPQGWHITHDWHVDVTGAVDEAGPNFFQLRCYIFQALELTPRATKATADPVAHVSFVHVSQSTRVLPGTLDPLWDQTLLFQRVLLYGDPQGVQDEPPMVVVEVFDQDGGAAEEEKEEDEDEDDWWSKFYAAMGDKAKRRTGRDRLKVTGTIPLEKDLRVTLLDYDVVPPDQEIGTTTIDLENRLLSRYRANCGLAARYRTYELRCVVWNTRDIDMGDVNLIGQQMSDIYVMGWLDGLEEQRQRTDIHYRSLQGDGAFNWRFVFSFQCLAAEELCILPHKARDTAGRPEWSFLWLQAPLRTLRYGLWRQHRGRISLVLALLLLLVLLLTFIYSTPDTSYSSTQRRAPCAPGYQAKIEAKHQKKTNSPATTTIGHFKKKLPLTW
ncbi:hypothetical protein Q9966_013665 [Columba livia]|nr:hypothetical protein Q9966_013665 [Columba livia]